MKKELYGFKLNELVLHPDHPENGVGKIVNITQDMIEIKYKNSVHTWCYYSQYDVDLFVRKATKLHKALTLN